MLHFFRRLPQADFQKRQLAITQSADLQTHWGRLPSSRHSLKMPSIASLVNRRVPSLTLTRLGRSGPNDGLHPLEFSKSLGIRHYESRAEDVLSASLLAAREEYNSAIRFWPTISNATGTASSWVRAFLRRSFSASNAGVRTPMMNR
jgi:hypothetical protein